MTYATIDVDYSVLEDLEDLINSIGNPEKVVKQEKVQKKFGKILKKLWVDIELCAVGGLMLAKDGLLLLVEIGKVIAQAGLGCAKHFRRLVQKIVWGVQSFCTEPAMTGEKKKMILQEIARIMIVLVTLTACIAVSCVIGSILSALGFVAGNIVHGAIAGALGALSSFVLIKKVFKPIVKKLFPGLF